MGAGGDQQKRDLGYTVWYANSALLDMPFRPHLWIKEGETHYLPTDTGHVASNIANARMREELEPYYYQAAQRASQDGTPIVAPLYYYHPHDPTVQEMGHEAYVGKDLLMGVVANVYETSRNVYLPEGGWYDYHTNQFHPASGNGGQWLKDVPVKRDGNLAVPLFAREGAIIPLDRITAYGERVANTQELRVRVFAGETPTETTIHDDDGATRIHDSQLTRIAQAKTLSGYDVTVFPSTGTFEGAIASRPQRIEMVVPTGSVSKVEINGKDMKVVSREDELTGSEPLVYFDLNQRLAVAYSPYSGAKSTTYSFVTH